MKIWKTRIYVMYRTDYNIDGTLCLLYRIAVGQVTPIRINLQPTHIRVKYIGAHAVTHYNIYIICITL